MNLDCVGGHAAMLASTARLLVAMSTESETFHSTQRGSSPPLETEDPLEGDDRIGVAFDGDIGCRGVDGKARHCGGVARDDDVRGIGRVLVELERAPVDHGSEATTGQTEVDS